MAKKKFKPSPYTFLFLRVVLGLLFLYQGFGKLSALFSGGPGPIEFFASLGIPAAGFFAWAVALAEFFGGLFLVLGFLTWWSSLVLAVIMVVATALTTLAPFNAANFLTHLVYVSGLVTLMLGKDTYLAIDDKCGWKQY